MNSKNNTDVSKGGPEVSSEGLGVTPPPRGRGWGRGLALFPGSFDPFTIGHDDIVRRALGLFDVVVVAVGRNDSKAGWLSVGERVEAIKRLYRDEPRVRAESYSGLTADFAREQGATAIVRGVRTAADFEYELQMADVNRRLTGIETVLLPASPELASLSSSVVRELARFHHDVSEFLP